MSLLSDGNGVTRFPDGSFIAPDWKYQWMWNAFAPNGYLIEARDGTFSFALKEDAIAELQKHGYGPAVGLQTKGA